MAVVAEAELGQYRLDEARDAVAKARVLTSKSEERHVITAVGIAGARVDAASGKSDAALRGLGDLLAELKRLGLVSLEFDTREAIGEIEMKSGRDAAGRADLQALEKDAEAKGFLLIARKAHAAGAGG